MKRYISYLSLQSITPEGSEKASEGIMQNSEILS